MTEMFFRSLINAAMLLIVFMTPNAHAQTNDMAIEVASDHVDVTVGFTGGAIELFGDRRDKDTKIAIVVEGPRQDMVIWKKERVLGAWMNRRFIKMKNMPVYYQYAFSDLDNVDEYKDVFLQNDIGYQALIKNSKKDQSDGIKNSKEYTNAFLEKKVKNGLYFTHPAELKFLNDNFFRVSFEIPPSAEVGEYTVYSYLIKGNKVIQKQKKNLVVEQVGLNAFINKTAQENSAIYAITCIFIAVFFGWLVSVLRVKP